jgi:hypothetical protein
MLRWRMEGGYDASAKAVASQRKHVSHSSRQLRLVDSLVH